MIGLTDRERYPLMTPEACRFLEALRQDPHAPKWNHRCGDRLDREGLARVQQFEKDLRAPVSVGPAAWVTQFARRCLSSVPHYRGFDVALADTDDSEAFGDIPTTSRDTLARTPWMLVPDECSLEHLIVYDTSGRTGHPVVVPTHPVVSSMYLPLLRSALAVRGIALGGGPGRVAIVNACYQRTTFAFASVSSFLEWAGFAKVNLDPTGWRNPGDRARFLDTCNPEIYTGDPLSFAALATLPLTTRPKALVSTSMEMPPEIRAGIEGALGCPVVELYSLTESGPVAVLVDGSYRLLRHDLYVEVVDDCGRHCQPGERGEIVLTGGQNPFFPLLRYRTGDRAALVDSGDGPRLVNLEGRAAVIFRDDHGRLLNNVDIAAALRPLRLPRFRLHQSADASVSCEIDARHSQAEARAALQTLFGPGIPVAIEVRASDELCRAGSPARPTPAMGQLVQCSSDILWESPRPGTM